MEAKSVLVRSPRIDLPALFSDLVRLETELWDLTDSRLRRDHDLPLSWFEPMQVMDRVANCRVADIAQALSITVGGTSKLVDRIERAGWCGREPNPGDARSSFVDLTPAGRRLLRDAQVSLEDELESCLGGALRPEQLVSLASSVHNVRQHLAAMQGVTR